MSAADRRLGVALVAGGVVTGATAGTTGAWAVNLVEGLALGIPVAVAVWCVLTVAHHVIGGAR